MRIMLDEGAFMPSKVYPEDAGFDLHTPKKVVIPPDGGSAAIDTGVHMEIPSGYFGKLESKSGLLMKYGVASLGGVIDSGYTGSIRVKLHNFGSQPYTFEPGDKIVQLIIVPFSSPILEQVDSLEETERGSKGFGSTGR